MALVRNRAFITSFQKEVREWLRWRERSVKVSGGKEIRTPDPELAKLVLYQLSYTPGCS